MDFIVDGFEDNNFNDIENKTKYDVIEKDNIVFVNSIDRNYAYDTNYNFTMNFTSTNLSNGFVNKDFKNITKIELVNLIIKNIYINQAEVISLYNNSIITSETTGVNSNNIRLQRVSDLPYLLLSIEDLSNNNYGSNKEINKSTFTLIIDDSFENSNNNSGFYTLNTNYIEYGNIGKNILAQTDKKRLRFKYIDDCPIMYFPSVKNNLKNLKFTLKTPSGKILANLNDKLAISNIALTDIGTGSGANLGGQKLVITFNSYFSSDEYNIGDKIIFKNLTINNSNIRTTSLIQFLMKSEGHSIIGIFGDDANKLYNSVYIPLEYNLDLTTITTTQSYATIKDNFGLTKYTRSNIVSSATNNTITLDNSASSSNDVYNNLKIKIYNGKGNGQIRTISDYVGLTNVATVNEDWEIQPDSTSSYAIYVDSSIINVSSGIVLNTNLENIIIMKITHEIRDNMLLHTNIIN